MINNLSIDETIAITLDITSRSFLMVS